MSTYEDTLLGTGFIPGWPGTWSNGTRIIRDKATGEIVDVLPPLTPEEQEALPPTPVEAVVTEEAAPTETIAQPEGGEV